MQIRLTCKFALALNGLDLRPFTVGEVIELEDSFAHMLLRERWAELPVFNRRPTADAAPRLGGTIDPASAA
jgi:hypothetical protein